MHKEDKILQELFSQKLENFEVMPSPKVWGKVSSKLFFSEFFSFRPNRFNVYYSAASVILIGAGIFMFASGSLVNSSKNLLTSQNNEDSHVTIDDLSGKREIGGQTTFSLGNKTQMQDGQSSGSDNSQNLLADKSESSDSKLKPQAIFEISSDKGCLPHKVSFSNKSVKAKKLHWSFGDGHFSELANPEHVYQKGGTYICSLEIIGEDDKKYHKKRTIVVFDKPEAGFVVDMEKSDYSKKLVYYKNSSQRAEKYKWKFGDKARSTEADPYHQYEKHDIYEVSLQAINEHSCSDTFTMRLAYLLPECTISFPTSFSPKPFGKSNGYYDSETQKSSIFYPVKYSGIKDYMLKVYNSQGVLIFTSTNVKQGWNGFINNRVAQKGTYLWEAEGQYVNGKQFKLKDKVVLVYDSSFEVNEW